MLLQTLLLHTHYLLAVPAAQRRQSLQGNQPLLRVPVLLKLIPQSDLPLQHLYALLVLLVLLRQLLVQRLLHHVLIVDILELLPEVL